MRRDFKQLRYRFAPAAFLLTLAIASSLFAAEPKAIDDAIKRGRDYLYTLQKDNNWEKSAAPNRQIERTDPDGGQWGSSTAMAVYALLNCGEHYEEPRLKAAVDFLLDADLIGVYAVAMRSQALSVMPKSDRIKKVMQRDLDFLKKALRDSGTSRGFFDYIRDDQRTNRIDQNISQFGVLGAWTLSETVEGFSMDDWKSIDQAWRSSQHEDGAWSYNRNATDAYPKTVTLTAAGVSVMLMTQDVVNRGKSLDAGAVLTDPTIVKGLKWINDNYNTLLDNDKTVQNNTFSGLYAIERIGLASGYQYLGKVDWYKEGSDHLVKAQLRNGGWTGAVNTSLALIFLTHGRFPVMLNKLSYELPVSPARGARMVEAAWNQRPRDAANLARFVSHQTERKLNWQIVNFRSSPQQLLDSPILYISGNQALTFTAEQKQILKQYVDNGGLILAHADGGTPAFATSIRRLATELFKYEFRPLPQTHPIYTIEQFTAASWKRKPIIQGLSNGVRELILLVADGDYSRYWQAYDIGGRSELFEVIANVYLYTVDKQNFRNKGETYLVKADDSIKTDRAIKVARLKYAGNWDPEPAGWARLAAILNNEQKIALSTETVDLAKLTLSGDIKIAHLTGSGAVRFTAPERDAIRAFVVAGGTLIIDAAGGSAPFAQAVDQELETIFGDTAKSLKDPLPAEHAIYRNNGQPIAINYRPFSRLSLGGELKAGRLRGMKFADRLAVICSHEDLSAGLVGMPVDGIAGYSPAVATSLMQNILISAGLK